MAQRVGFFSQVTGDRMRGNGLKLCQGRFGLNIRNKLLSERVERKHWNRLSRGAVESLFLEVLKKCVEAALRNMLSGHGEDGLMAGLGYLKGLFQP